MLELGVCILLPVAKTKGKVLKKCIIDLANPNDVGLQNGMPMVTLHACRLQGQWWTADAKENVGTELNIALKRRTARGVFDQTAHMHSARLPCCFTYGQQRSVPCISRQL